MVWVGLDVESVSVVSAVCVFPLTRSLPVLHPEAPSVWHRATYIMHTVRSLVWEVAHTSLNFLSGRGQRQVVRERRGEGVAQLVRRLYPQRERERERERERLYV